jgi:hypothetical protein
MFQRHEATAFHSLIVTFMLRSAGEKKLGQLEGE